MGTDFNYDDTSHQVIFDHINGGAGSDALQETARSWRQLGDGVGTTCKSYVQSAIGVILSSRQGAAADSAAAATGAMLPWMDTVVQTTAAVAQRAQGQAEHWVNAKNSVPPVPPTPKSAGFSSDPGEWAAEKMDWFPGITSDEEKAQQRQQDAAEQARQAMRVYQSNSNGNIDVAPAFTPPQALDGSIGSLPPANPQIDATGSAPPAITSAGGGAPTHVRAADQPATPPAAHQRAAAYQPAPTVSQLAHTAPAAAAGNLAPSSSQGALGEDLTPGGLPVSTGLESTTGSARPVSARGSAAGQRAGGTGGGSHTGFGPRPSTGFGPRPTVSARPALDEMSATRGSSGPAIRSTGEAGYGQPFGAGAPNQQSERDREHRSKYLIQEDSNAIVGQLPPTAPPVIGADY